MSKAKLFEIRMSDKTMWKVATYFKIVEVRNTQLFSMILQVLTMIPEERNIFVSFRSILKIFVT